jgi:hypothetical protein
MKEQFIVIAFDNAEDSYVVDDVIELICEMYKDELMNEDTFEEDFNKVNNKFYSYHKVFKIKGEIEELN